MLEDLPTSKLANEAGVSEQQINQAFETLGPVVLGQLEKKRVVLSDEELEALIQRAGGQENVGEIVESQADDGVSLDPDLTVNGLFESSTGDQAASAVSQRAGIAGPVARKLLPMLVPIILGMLMKKGKEDPATETRTGGIKSILDRDGDGQVIDDIFGMLMGGKGGGGSQSFLAKIMAMFFGKK